MNEVIERSRHRINTRMGWAIQEDTFKILNEDKGRWMARVTTTHLAARGEEEITFPIIVSGSEHFVLEDEDLPLIGEWIKEQ